MNILKKEYLSYLKDNMEGVGKKYERETDALPFISNAEIAVLKSFVNDLYDTLTLSTKVEWVDNEPYDYLGEGHLGIFEDYKKGYIKVPTGDDNSKLFGDVNLKFRATHDIIHAITQKSFDYKDEIDTFAHTAHIFLMWARGFDEVISDKTKLEIVRILRSEIVYQSAFKNLQTKNNIDQKVILQD